MTRDRAMAIIVAVLSAAVIVLAVVTVSNRDRATSLAREIQSQRHASVLSNCRAQNAKHDNALAALPASKLLIDALAPRQDCATALARAFGGATGVSGASGATGPTGF